MATIENSIQYVLANEGGAKYTDIPGDAGGPTKYGITLATLASFRHKSVTSTDVKNLGLPEAMQIYKAHYWDILNLDQVTDQNIATAIFDTSVNRGPGIAKQYEQRTCQTLGVNTPNLCGQKAFIDIYANLVKEGYLAIVASHPSQVKFEKGWLNRANRLLSLA